jgi:plasmid stability protein
MQQVVFSAVLSAPKFGIIPAEAPMNTVIERLPVKIREKLDMRAKVSGRSVEAEAAAILSASLEGENLENRLTPPSDMDELQRMVWEAYGGRLPGNVVDEYLAERERMWGED